MAARVTLKTVADAIGVSRMTVSNAFSRPDQLSAELRRRILETADRLGYVGPDPAARALARGSTGTVGILFNARIRDILADDVSSAFLGGIADGLAVAGLSMTLLSTMEADGRVPARDVPMDAAMVFGSGTDAAAMQWLRRRGLPLVTVDQQPLPDAAAVTIDDRGGARAAAQHLLDLGHRDIGVVTVGTLDPFGLQPTDRRGSPEQEWFVTRERLRGWFDATDGRAAVRVVTSPKAPYQPESDGYRGLGALLEARPGLTAVLCFSDTMALGVLAAAHDHGLGVPGELSVVGFDDSPLAASTRPTLTTVRQDVAEKGHLAAAALLAAVRGKGEASPTHAILPTTLVVRDSTGPPPRDLARSGVRRPAGP